MNNFIKKIITHKNIEYTTIGLILVAFIFLAVFLFVKIHNKKYVKKESFKKKPKPQKQSQKQPQKPTQKPSTTKNISFKDAVGKYIFVGSNYLKADENKETASFVSQTTPPTSDDYMWIYDNNHLKNKANNLYITGYLKNSPKILLGEKGEYYNIDRTFKIKKDNKFINYDDKNIKYSSNASQPLLWGNGNITGK